MEGPVKYEVHWTEKGNPKNGIKVSEGEILALKSGQVHEISYQPIKNGNYMFKAYQRPNHPGKGELWSDGIAVTTCSVQSDPSEMIKEKEEVEINPLKPKEDNNSSVAENLTSTPEEPNITVPVEEP